MADVNLSLALFLAALLFAVAIGGSVAKTFLVVPALALAIAAVVYDARPERFKSPIEQPPIATVRHEPHDGWGRTAARPELSPTPDPVVDHKYLADQLSIILKTLDPPPKTLQVTSLRVDRVETKYHLKLTVPQDREIDIISIHVRFCTYGQASIPDCKHGIPNRRCPPTNYLCGNAPRTAGLSLDRRATHATLPWQNPRNDAGLEIDIGTESRQFVCKARARSDAKDVPSMFAGLPAECA